MAFRDCINLSKISLGEGLEEIGDEAFFNCSKLSSIILPNSLEKLGQKAFCSCSSLANVSYKQGLKVDESFQNTPWSGTNVNLK